MRLAHEPAVGLLRKATIESYNSTSKQAVIVFDSNISPDMAGKFTPKTTITIPTAIAYNNGLFVGSKPVEGTPIVVGQGEGNVFYFVSFLPQGAVFKKYEETEDDVLTISSSKDSYIKLNTDKTIKIGSYKNNITTYSTKENLVNYKSSNFDNIYTNTQADISISGVIKREISHNSDFNDNSKLLNDDYYMFETKTVCFDNSLGYNNTNSKKKNPPFVEKRELIREFALISNVQRDQEEAELYSENKNNIQKNVYPDRRNSRSNAFSLSLFSPNELMEEIKGTGVDVFGNILDINRKPLQIGKDKLSLDSQNTKNSKESFLLIKEEERKSIAYHFEINAKKDLTVSRDFFSEKDYARARSRLFFDIDKEGQFKINIPSSSESGNVPLLTRYENFSEFQVDDEEKADTQEPNKLLYRADGLDIRHDSFAAKKSIRKDVDDNAPGVITVKKNGQEITPIDRITNKHIRYGTAFHDITDTCFAHQSNDYIKYQIEDFITISSDVSDKSSVNEIHPIKDIISDSMDIGKNAGGRSGSITFDGSIDMNIGANTLDRQSLIMDTAGGNVINLGKDKRNISAAISMDGHLLMQVGNWNIDSDSRFGETSTFSGGAIDIRVINSGGKATMVRIDDMGVTIMSPTRLSLSANGDINITSTAKIALEAEEIVLNNRLVSKNKGSI